MKLRRHKGQKELKRWSKKRAFIFVAVLALIAGGVGAGFYLFKSKDGKKSSVCSEVNGVAAKDIAALLSENDVEKLGPLKESISANDKAEDDADCQYILLGYNVSISNPEEAQKKLDGIKKLDENYSPVELFGEGALALDLYANTITAQKDTFSVPENSELPGSASERISQ